VFTHGTHQSERILEVVLVRYQDEWVTPVRYAVRVSKAGKIGDIKQEVCRLSGLPVNQVALADVYGNRIYAYLHDLKETSMIKTTDYTYAYEHPPNIDSPDLMRIQVLHRTDQRKKVPIYQSSMEVSVPHTHTWWFLFSLFVLTYILSIFFSLYSNLAYHS
jgi:hypothetical protein